MQVRRSLWITFAVSNGQTILFFLGSLVLARLLKPDEIGAFSVAVTVCSIAGVFRDFGSGTYIVSRQELTERDLGLAFTITGTLSLVFAIGLWSCRGLLADYYRDPRIADLVQVLAFNFVLVPPSAILSSVLARRLHAKPGAIVSVSACVSHVLVSISLAYLGFGALSLAFANTVVVLVNLLGFWIARDRELRIRPVWRGWKEPLQFGKGVVLSSLVTMATSAIPDLFIGRRLGTYEVGLYSRANGLTSMFQQAFGPALGFNTLPVLANAHREGDSAFRYTLQRSTELITGLAFPIYVWVAVFSEAIIQVLYGKAWLPAAALVPWLCLIAAVRTPFSVLGPALQAINRPMGVAWAALPTLLLRVLFLALVPVEHVTTIVIALVAADLIATIAWGRIAQQLLRLSVRDLMRTQSRSAVVLAAALAAAIAVRGACAALHSPAIIEVIVSLAVVAGVSAWTLFATKHALGAEVLRLGGGIRRALRRA